jgi:xanthine dehydrogenase accessory factor
MATGFSSLILVLGVGDVASAVAHRLFKARFKVLMTENLHEQELKRYTSFSRVFEKGMCEVEGVTARQAVVTEALGLVDRGCIPVLSVDARSAVEVLNPEIVVECRGERRLALEPDGRSGIAVGDVSLIIAATPRFSIGDDCDMAVVVHRGHDLGRAVASAADRVAETARALEEAAGPGPMHAVAADVDGLFMPLKKIGDQVKVGEEIGTVGDKPVSSQADGVVRGLLDAGAPVREGGLVAEVELSGREETIYTISDRDRAISGTVLEMSVAWSLDVGAFSMPGPYFPRE